MRFVVFGAGAIGGVVGGRLAEHGHDVVLVARGAHAAAMRAGGLRIEAPSGSTTVALPVVEHPGELTYAEGDVVLLCVKSQDTVAALDALAGVASAVLPIVCMQNGVANEPAALRRFASVHSVPVMCPTAHLEPGVVLAYSEPVVGILDIGRYPSGADETTAEVAVAFVRSGFVSEIRTDVMRWKWSKLLTNLGNAIEAVCGLPARSGPLAALVRREGEACLAAAGIDHASEEEDRARRGDLLRLAPVGGRLRGGGSSWQSLARGGGSIETDFINGEVVLLGRLYGVATPANELLQLLAGEMARAGAAPGTVEPDRLLSELAT